MSQSTHFSTQLNNSTNDDNKTSSPTPLAETLKNADLESVGPTKRIYLGSINLIYMMMVVIAVILIVSVSFFIGEVVSEKYGFIIGLILTLCIMTLFVIMNLKLDLERRLIGYSILATILGIFVSRTSQTYSQYLKSFS